MNGDNLYMVNRNNINILNHNGFPQNKVFNGEIKVVMFEKIRPHFWSPIIFSQFIDNSFYCL